MSVEEHKTNLRLHALLVHFPVSCWSIASVLEMSELFRSEPLLFGVDTAAAALALIWLGLSFATLAAVAGLYEAATAGAQVELTRHIHWHMTFVLSAATCYLIGGLSMQGIEGMVLPAAIQKATIALGFLFLMIGGHLGGQLVCRKAN